MKYLLLLLTVCLLSFKVGNKNSVYQFKVKDIKGKTLDLSKYKGKKILIVNTASKCGYTYQYEGLEKLHAAYKNKLVVIGVPANNFGGQEPGTEEEIQEFCSLKYNVSFLMTSKMSVKGDDTTPLFQWLTQKAKNGVLDANIAWNFNKFLLDENGKLIQHFNSKVEPMSEAITNYLK